MSWFSQTKDGLVLRLYIQPGASQSGVDSLYGDPPRLKLRIAAPPVDGKANDEVVDFLSRLLLCSPRQLNLIRGEKSRKKDVLWRDGSVAGLSKIPLMAKS